jgi:autotransporter-associated beta strand protein
MLRNRISGWTTVAAMVAMCLAVASVSNAGTYTWALGGAGNWDGAGAWGAGMPSASGDIAVFNDALTFAVSLDGADRTVGQIQFMGAGANYTISPSGAEIFHLMDPSGTAVIQVGQANSSATFTGAVSLDATTVQANVVGTLNFNGGLLGSGLLQKLGVGTMVISGSNASSGGMRIDAGTARVMQGVYGSGGVQFGGTGALLQDYADAAFANHTSTNVTMLTGVASAQIYVADSLGRSWATRPDPNGNLGTGATPFWTHTYGGMTFADTVNAQTLFLNGARSDAIALAGTITLNAADVIMNGSGPGAGPMIYLNGKITGTGSLTAAGIALLDGGTNSGGLVISNLANNYSGGTYIEGRTAITGSDVLGSGPVHLVGGTLFSSATTNQEANHANYNLLMDRSSGITLITGWTINSLNSAVTGDPNVVTHQFGGLTFTATQLTLTTAGAAADGLTFLGTVTLDGNSSIGGGPMVLMSGVVKDTTGVASKLIVNDAAGVFLSNASNSYTGGTLSYGGLVLNNTTNPLGTGGLTLAGGTLYSIASSNANADHSAIPITITASTAITLADGWTGDNVNNKVFSTSYPTNPADANYWRTGDPNQIVHKFGNITFATAGLTLTVNREGTDPIWFEGTITLNGSTTISVPYQNVTPANTPAGLGGWWPGETIRIDGMINAPDANSTLTLNGTANNWAGTSIFWVTNPKNNYGNLKIGTGPNSYVFMMPGSQGTGTLFVNGAGFYDVASNNVDANHSDFGIQVAYSGYGYGWVADANVNLFGTSGSHPPTLVGVQSATMGANGSDTYSYGAATNIVTHVFQDLSFTGPSYAFFAGNYDGGNGSNIIQFSGTTWLYGPTYFISWEEQIILAGGVADGNGVAGRLITGNANAGNGIWLMKDGTYTGGTEIHGAGGYLVIESPHAMGTGPVYMDGGVLYSQALDDGNADHSIYNVTIGNHGGRIVGAKVVRPAPTQSQASSGSQDYLADANAYNINSDANFNRLVTHKFGGLSWDANYYASATPGFSVGVAAYKPISINGPYLTDRIEFMGTVSLLAGKTTSIYTQQPLIFHGDVIGGNMDVTGVPGTYTRLDSNNNSYGRTTIESVATLQITSSGALGSGAVFLNGGTLMSLADNDANANHSYANVTLVANSTISTLDSSAQWNGQVGAANHLFGGLKFLTGSLTLFVGNNWQAGAFGDSLHFVGTTQITGISTFNLSPYGLISLDGQVTGTGTILPIGYQSVLILRSNDNDFLGGGLHLDDGNNFTYLTSANAAGSAATGTGTASIRLNGGNLRSSATNNADADHTATSLAVYANSSIEGQQGGLYNNLYTNPDDPNVVVHKFGDLNFGLTGLTLSVGLAGGNHVIDGTDQIWIQGTTTLNGTTNIVANQMIVLNGYVTGAGGPGTGNLSVTGTKGVVLISDLNDYLNTTVNPGATVTAKAAHALGTGTVYVNGGTLHLQHDPITFVVGNLLLGGTPTAPSGQVDIHDNYLVVQTPGKLAAVNAWISAGINQPNYDWLGQGITSSNAAADAQVAGKLAVGCGNADDEGITGSMFGTHYVADGNETLIRLTLVGDTDLNGVVNVDDYNTLRGYYGQTNATWEMGDFDYNGVVNADDYNALRAFYNQSYVASAPDAPGAVPEPATLVLLGLGAVALLKRRKNRA